MSKNICKVCKREFILKDSLNHHLEKHHGYEAVSYKCSHCFKRFRWSANLDKHMKEVHTDLVRHECGICASIFKYDHHLKQHMRMKHNPYVKPNKCPDCGMQIERRELFLRHLKSNHPKAVVPVQCKSCPMVFISRAKLRHHHLKIHANFERAKCPHCPSSFKWRGHLSGHIKKKHMTNIHVDERVINKKLEKSRERTNRCRHCGAIFKLKFDLLVHYKRSHDENISIYQCCQCEVVFIIKSSLERHIVEYHTKKNMRKHRCEQCFPDINVKPIAIKVEPSDDRRDEGNCLEENKFDTYVATDVRNEISDNFEHTISDHPDLRDMILMKSRFSNAALNNDKAMLSLNGQSKAQQIVEFEVPLLNSEMEDEAKIGNRDSDANRDASTQLNFYEDMFCNKINSPITLYSSLDGDLWKSLSNIENPLRIDVLSDTSLNAQTHQKKMRKTRADSRKSTVRYRCEECNIYFNMSNSLDNHIQTEHGNENVDVGNEKSVEMEDNKPHDTFVDREQAEKEDSVNTGAVAEKVLQIHLQKLDMKLLKNKVLVCDVSNLSPSPTGFYDCKHCGSTFRYKRHYLRHAYQKHGLCRTQYNCSKCDLKFDTRMQLGKHIRNFHLHEDKMVTKACATSSENTKNNDNDSEQHNQDAQLHLNNESEESSVPTILHECDLCDRKYKLFSQLRRHKTLKHQNVQSYKCKHCSKLFTNNVLRRRHVLTTHSQLNKFVCKICNLKFKQNILLKSHNDREHTKNETLKNKSTLMKNMGETLGNKLTKKDTRIETKQSDGISKRDGHAQDPSYSNNVVRCDLCNEIFKLKIQLLKHKNHVHGQYETKFSCNLCKSIFKSKRALNTHYNLKHSDYYCYECDLSFRNDSLLQCHIEVSHDDTLINNNLSSGHMDIVAEHKLKLSCVKCNLTFNTESQMDTHIESLHFNTSVDNDVLTTSNCKKCNLNFNTESEMNEHIIEMHPTKKVTFRCSVCHARFDVRDNLLHHIDIEHRHKCGICQIKFQLKDELLRHMAITHCLSVRVYNCEKCPMTFRLVDSLNRHLREMHSKVAKSTKTGSAIQEQSMPHIMMKKCKHCDALFPKRDSLERHIKQEHPTCISFHKCGQCASAFSDIEDLKAHLRMEHFADIIVYKAAASKSTE